jgi:hypothetical protein
MNERGEIMATVNASAPICLRSMTSVYGIGLENPLPSTRRSLSHHPLLGVAPALVRIAICREDMTVREVPMSRG